MNSIHQSIARLLGSLMVLLAWLVGVMPTVSAQTPVERAVRLTRSLEAANQLNDQLLLVVAGGFLMTTGIVTVLSSTAAHIIFKKKVNEMIQ